MSQEQDIAYWRRRAFEAELQNEQAELLIKTLEDLIRRFVRGEKNKRS